jgi:hypothetical protein
LEDWNMLSVIQGIWVKSQAWGRRKGRHEQDDRDGVSGEGAAASFSQQGSWMLENKPTMFADTL